MATDQPQGLDLAAFARLVDTHLTPPMGRLGYHRLPAHADRRAESTRMLSRDRRPRLLRSLSRVRSRRSGGTGPGRWRYEVGYEAADVGAMTRMSPDDPLSADELHLEYDPVSGALDVHLGLRMEELGDRFAGPDEAATLMSPDEPIEARLAILGEVLGRYADSRSGR